MSDRRGQPPIALFLPPVWPLTLACAAVVAMTAATALIGLDSPIVDRPAVFVTLRSVFCLGLVAIAVVTLVRGPSDRMAALFVAAAGALAVAGLTAADSPLPFAIGRIAATIAVLLTAYVCFAYPDGHIEDGASARFLGVSAAVAMVLLAANLLLSDVPPVAGPFVRCSGSACPTNPLDVASLGSGPGEALSKALGLATTVILAAVAVLLARRAVRATPLRRRSLVPLLTWAVLAALGFGAYIAVRALDSDADVLTPAAVTVAAIIATMPFAITLGVVRGRVFAMAALERVVAELERAPSLAALERTMSRAFADPTLRLLRWVPQTGCYVDTGGEPVDISTLEGGAGRRVTTWEGRGESHAALVHDPILAEDVVHAAGSAIGLALDNARLHDDLVSSIGELEASRQRVASAVDEERRRIELDLHDGAQQRLIALRFQLQMIEELAAENPQSLGPALADAGKQVDTAINQIRGLAKGIYPVVLRDFGLPEGLVAAARELPIDVAVHAARAGRRFAPEIETAVYFCCLEALQNVAKHGGPDVRAEVRLTAHAGNLLFAVADDGRGFDPVRRTPTRGITGMRDRLAAVGGRLTIASEPGRGTTVGGTVPIGPN